jgi:hypothetical protein
MIRRFVTAVRPATVGRRAKRSLYAAAIVDLVLCQRVPRASGGQPWRLGQYVPHKSTRSNERLLREGETGVGDQPLPSVPPERVHWPARQDRQLRHWWL